MIGRKMLLQELLETRRAGYPRFAFLIVRAGLIVEVPRTGDVGILKRIGPGSQLPRAALGN